MSTFEERLRARIDHVISETMDDVASEIRKAVTPKATCNHVNHAGGHKPHPTLGCWCGYGDCTTCPDVIAARGEAITPKPEGPATLRLAGRDDMFGSQVWLNFDEKAFKDWFIKQIRIHGGLQNFLPR